MPGLASLTAGGQGIGSPAPATGTPGTSSPYNISGNLNFGSAPTSPFGGDISGAYTSAYNNALSLNQQNYSNILAGYNQNAQNLAGTSQGAYGLMQQGYNNLQGAQGQIQGGYGALGQNVQNTIQGIGASQAQSIRDTYKQQSGQVQQNLINSGLGNSTILNSMQRGPQLDEQKAQIALSNQLAQLSAGYQSQLGLAGLGYAGQAAQQNLGQTNAMAGYANQVGLQNAGQANQQLGFMNSVQSPYPSAQTYAQLLANQGAQGIAQQQLDLAKKAYGRSQILPPGSMAPPMYPSRGNMQARQSQVGQGGGYQPTSMSPGAYGGLATGGVYGPNLGTGGQTWNFGEQQGQQGQYDEYGVLNDGTGTGGGYDEYGILADG